MNKKIAIILIVFIIALQSSLLVCASDINMFYKRNSCERFADNDLLGLYVENQLNNSFLLSAYAADSNFLGSTENCQEYEVGIYKKLKFDSDFDYYLGTGYNYYVLEKEDLEKKLLFLNLKGINQRNNYTVISEISYAPFGKYSLNNNADQNMNSWNLNITYRTHLLDDLYVSLLIGLGKEYYEEFTTASNQYQLGIGWDL